MKSIFLRTASLLLAVLLLLTACTSANPSHNELQTTTPVDDNHLSTEKEPDSNTEESVTDTETAPDTAADTNAETAPDSVTNPTPDTEAETDAPDTSLRETYEDLSHSVPAVQGVDGKIATAAAKGERTAPNVVLEFDGQSGLFVLSSIKAVEVHDSTTCEECGFQEDGSGYFLTTHNLGDAQAGFTVTLATPLPLDSVTGMTVTYRTSSEAVNSVFRVMTHYCLTMATFHNECPSLSGASEEYRTVDVNITDWEALTDDDGSFSTFQFYFRNKDKIDCTVKTLTVCINPEKLMVVDEIEGNYFSRGDVTKAIAETIAARFEGANVGAEITVEVDKYRQNSSKMDGSILYVATAVLNDGTIVTSEGKVIIPHVSGVWLDTTTGSFGATHDNRGEWQDTFDPSGMVLLTDNTLTAKEKMKTAEYALIPVSASYDASDVIWRAPHILDMSDEGFSTLFVNAWLDHADVLTEGDQYRLLVRGVTEYDNYILHLDIPFTYSPLDRSVTEKLEAALEALNAADFICPADTPDKTVYITEQLKALLGDSTLEVRTELLGEGVNSATVQVTVCSNAAVTENRLPIYTVNGTVLDAVYGFAGDAMTTGILNFSYDVYEGSIRLLTPFDGDPAVVQVSPEIYALWNAPISEIESGKYPFKRGEYCLPVPVELTWEDAASDGKTYTVTVSENRDLTDPMTFTVSECAVHVPNLESGQTYYWQVSDGTETSQLFTFRTADGYPRFFSFEGVSNFRDLGGYVTVDGKRVKQNMVFRSAYLNGASDEAKAYMTDILGIKTELDLRGSGAPAFGSSVDRHVIPMMWYGLIFNEDDYEASRETLAAFAYPENYPMNFHCAIGRDRTGTTAFLILGLLGVDEETLLREYYSSFFSQSGSCDRDELVKHVANIHGLMNGLTRYAPKATTLQEKIESYMLKVGVTEAEIAAIRNILLEP